MEIKVIIGVVLASVVQSALGTEDPSRNYIGSEIRTKNSMRQEFEKIGELAYSRACHAVFTDTFESLDHPFRRDGSSRDDTYESGKTTVARSLIYTLDATFNAMSLNYPKASGAISAAEKKTYPQSAQMADLFYNMLNATRLRNATLSRLRINELERVAIASVRAFEEDVAAPALRYEKIAGDRSVVEIAYLKAASELVCAIRHFTVAMRSLSVALRTGTEAARKSAYTVIKASQKAVCQRLQNNIGSRFILLKSQPLKESITQLAILALNPRTKDPLSYDNLLDDIIRKIDDYLSSSGKDREQDESGCDLCAHDLPCPKSRD